jgi:protein gp37
LTTKIEWTDETWNPVTGCTKVSQGCKNCYAERLWPKVEGARVKRDGGQPRPFTTVSMHPDRLEAPLHWRTPRQVFVNSMSDLFHEDVPDEFIDKVFAVMGTCTWHTFQILTKRPERMLAWFGERWQAQPEEQQRFLHERIAEAVKEFRPNFPPFKYNPNGEDRFDQVFGALDDLDFCTDSDNDHLYTADGKSNLMAGGWPLKNVWLGVSAEDQATADERIPLLLHTPAAVRFVSYEPALGPVNFNVASAIGGWPVNVVQRGPNGLFNAMSQLDWIIAGGESGPHARPAHPDWLRSSRDQCAAAGVPFFFKQWGNWIHEAQMLSDGSNVVDRYLIDEDGHAGAIHDWDIRDGEPASYSIRIPKSAAGRTLDGRTHDEYPACG